MKLWFIEGNGYDGIIVRAETEDQARSIATKHDSIEDYTPDHWQNSKLTRCYNLPCSGNAEVLLSLNNNEFMNYGNWDV